MRLYFKIIFYENRLSKITLLFFLFGNTMYLQGIDDIKIETVRASHHVYMLVGTGGNISVSVGEDGVFVIDD